MGIFRRDTLEVAVSASGGVRPRVVLLIALLAGLPAFAATAASNQLNDEFGDYILAPCFLGGPTLTQPPYNWSNQEVIDYGNAICATLISGGYTSSSSTPANNGVGSVSAQAGSSNASGKLQTDSIQDRLDELQDEEKPRGGWGLLLSVQTGATDREETSNEQGYDSSLNGIVIGADYRFDDRLVTGLAVGVTQDKTDYDGDSGELDTDSDSLIGYVTYLVGDGGYVNGYLGYAALNYDNNRNFSIQNAAGTANIVDGKITADYDGDQLLAGISAGYDWYPGNYSVGVFFNYDYSKTEIDGYTEDGDTNYELVYPEQTIRSAPVMLGVNGSFVVDMGWGSLIPNASVAAVYESEQDSREYAARLELVPAGSPNEFTIETDDPDRNYGIATLGAVIATNSGTQYFVTYEQWFAHDFYDTWSLTAGALIEF